jgi:hypothetical protein
VEPGGLAAEYPSPPSSSDANGHDNPRLHHTTVWYFLSWQGSQGTALRHGREQVQQRDPTSTCHRFLGAVASHKFRSPQRERLLCSSRQLLHLIGEWERLFSPRRFFPRYATRAGFT